MPSDNTSPQPPELPASPGKKRRFDLVDLISSRIPMGSRKKSKPQVPRSHDRSQPTSAPPSPAAIPSSSTLPDLGSSDDEADSELPKTTAESTASVPARHVNAQAVPYEISRPGWYGSWRQKAQPVTEAKAENVSASSTPAAGSNTSLQSIRRKDSEPIASPSPRRYLSGSGAASTKATPLAAMTTNLSITSSNGRPARETAAESEETQDRADTLGKDLEQPPSSKPVASEPIKAPNPPSSSAGWLNGWWSRPDDYADQKAKGEAEISASNKHAQDSPPVPTAPYTEVHHEPQTAAVERDNRPTQDLRALANATEAESKVQTGENRSSWFWGWSLAQNSRFSKLSSENAINAPNSHNDAQQALDSSRDTLQVSGSGTPTSKSRDGSIQDGKEGTLRKPSGWAFWSRENSSSMSKDHSASDKQVGELAVADTPSQSHPEAAQFNKLDPTASKEPPKPAAKKTTGRRQQKETSLAHVAQETAEVDVAKRAKNTSTETLVEALAKQPRSSKQARDLLLPEFRKTYSLVQQTSLWQNIRHYFTGGEEHHPHLHILANVPRVRKALAIGVHGFFPAAILQKVLGTPTGTSIRFSNMAASAIQTWTESQGYECEIEKVALEGEGSIADRVETLWKLLLNWIDHVRSADLIIFACHSQGVPVTVMLVDRLIKLGCVAPSAKLGICAMAGVNLGPFAEYKTQLFGRSALELFEFSNSSSKVAKAHMMALEEVLKHRVKIVYVGSLDDQLVSLESSTFSTISHPCIYRAVFVDGRLFTSDFITELVGFALKLRNLGLSDHGLIRELSPALAGSLYTGEGHSRLYNCAEVYSLAVCHTVETTASENTALTVRDYEGPPGSKDSNPFFLPWAMRGVLEEERVRMELGDECRRLLALFENWKPTNKGLKDVKFRLEALKSKL